MATLVPMHDVVVVKPLEKSKTHNNFITSTKNEEEPDRGVVISVGPGKYTESGVFIPTTVTVGETVLYVKGSGAFIKLDDDVEKVVVLPEANIIGKII